MEDLVYNVERIGLDRFEWGYGRRREYELGEMFVEVLISV